MTDTALTPVDCFAGSPGGLISCQSACPCHFIGVDVDDSRLGINRWTTPLSAAIKARKVHGLLIQSKGNEQSFTAECAELIDCPCMCLRSAVGEHVLGQQLSGIRIRLERSRLRRRSHLSGNIAGRIALLFNWKQWLPGYAIKQIKVARFCCLSDRINPLSVMHHGQ